jgi:proline iminopeptidase
MGDGSRSRFVKFEGFRIYVREFGPVNAARTLLCIHGGPGGTHDYLLPLSALARHQTRVVFYDALGCGRSDLPDDLSRFTFEHDHRVLEAVRRTLDAKKIHLMGSSYGGMLALSYASRHSDELVSLNSTGGLCDVPYTVREMGRLVRGLPPSTQATLRKYGARGEYQHPDYETAMMVFYRRHLCRLWPWPADLTSTMMRSSRPVYGTMNGPNEFTIIGNIRDIDFTSKLRRISVPSLIVHGRYDEVTPNVGLRIQDQIPGSRFHVFPRSSHVSFWEERRDYLRLVDGLLRKSESGTWTD